MTGKTGAWDRQRTLVLLALATGHSRTAAAAKAGISDRTLRRWSEDEAFAESVEVAMGEGRAVYEQLLRDAGHKDWRAAFAAYESIYLGGRRGNAEANATVVIAAPPLPPPKELSEEEQKQIFDRAREVVRILVTAVGPERAAQVIAAREEERRRLG